MAWCPGSAPAWPGLGSDRAGRSRSSKLAVNRARAEAATTAAPMAFISDPCSPPAKRDDGSGVQPGPCNQIVEAWLTSSVTHESIGRRRR
jgi:hypothetical protein